MKPTYCKEYTEKNSFWNWYESGHYEEDYMLATTELAEGFKDDNFQLGMLYFEALDGIGHRYGPESPEVRSAVHMLDRIIGNFLNSVDYFKIGHKVNVVLVSDHGMIYGGNRTGKPFKVLDLDKMFIQQEAHIVINDLAYAQIWPMPGFTQEIYSRLLEAAVAYDSMHVYLRHQVPEYLHFRHNRRCAPIHVMVDSGYILGETGFEGFHGYDANKVLEMNAGFAAYGPGILSGQYYLLLLITHEAAWFLLRFLCV